MCSKEPQYIAQEGIRVSRLVGLTRAKPYPQYLKENEMDKDEMLERGLYADEDGRIFDAYGNEYRDENGQVCFLTEGELK